MSKNYDFLQKRIDEFNNSYNLPVIKPRWHQKLPRPPRFLDGPKPWAIRDSDFDGVPNYADRYPNDPFRR